MGWTERLSRGVASAGLLLSTLFSPDSNTIDCRTPSVTPNLHVETTYPNTGDINHISVDLEKVPDPIQKRVNENGYQVVIVDRPIGIFTKQYNIPEFPPGVDEITFTRAGTEITIRYEIDHLGQGRAFRITEDNPTPTERILTIFGTAAGVTSPLQKQTFIPQSEAGTPVTLHEYGHVADDVINSPSDSEEFLGVYKISVKRADELEKTDDKSREWQRSIEHSQMGYKEFFDRVSQKTVPIEELISRYALSEEERERLEAYHLIERYISRFYELHNPTEFWAGSFSAYFDSSMSKDALRMTYPEAHHFIRIWEQTHAPGCN